MQHHGMRIGSYLKMTAYDIEHKKCNPKECSTSQSLNKKFKFLNQQNNFYKTSRPQGPP